MHVVSHIPVYPDFRVKFHSSNWMYSIVGRIIEAVGGDNAKEGWGGFVRKRIINPLGMTRSATARAQLIDKNFAEPHTVLDNGKPARLPVPDFSDQAITGVLAVSVVNYSGYDFLVQVDFDALELESVAGNKSKMNSILYGISKRYQLIRSQLRTILRMRTHVASAGRDT